MLHVNPFGLLGGALSGTLPNPSLVVDEAGLAIATQVFGRHAVSGVIGEDDIRTDVFFGSHQVIPDVRAGANVTVTRDAQGFVVAAAAGGAADSTDTIIAGRSFDSGVRPTMAPVLLTGPSPEAPLGSTLAVAGPGLSISGAGASTIVALNIDQAIQGILPYLPDAPTQPSLAQVVTGRYEPEFPMGRALNVGGSALSIANQDVGGPEGRSIVISVVEAGAALGIKPWLPQPVVPDVRAGTNVTVTRDAGGYVVASTGGAGASATTVEANLGSSVAFSGKFTITDAAIGASSKVLCWQAPGPYTGKGTRADEAAAQPVNVTAVAPAAGSATVYWETPPMVIEVPVGTRSSPLGAGAASATGTNRQPQFIARRLGKVRGNVKFSYVVFS